jgi:hypothetical protein
VGSIVDRLELLAADRQLRERMSLDARNRANELGGWDICGENLVRLLRSLKAI